MKALIYKLLGIKYEFVRRIKKESESTIRLAQNFPEWKDSDFKITQELRRR